MSASIPPTRARLPYRPALDGLRAVAVVGVLVFHLDPEWLPGGWLGVDLFFVLSGFLITNLLVTEQDRWGRISLLRFWGARLRRLLPSLVTVLLAVSVAAWLWTLPGRRSAVAWDIVSSLFYVSNWRFMSSEEQYFDQLALPSPVRHTWSLSIEEQFYLAFPLLLIAVGFVVRRRAGQAAVFAMVAVASVALMARRHAGGVEVTELYFNTATRAFELFVGVCAALLLGTAAFRRHRRPRLVDAAGWTAVIAVVVAMVAVDAESEFVFSGGLLIVCLAALAAILAAASESPTSFGRVLGSRVPRWVGLISYPLYLWHWPVIVYASPATTGLDGLTLDVVRVVISVGAAWLTYRFVEGPLRARRPLTVRLPRVSRMMVGLAAPTVLVAAFGVASSEPVAGPAATAVGRSTVLTPERYAPRHPRVAVLVGNSIPYSLVHNAGETEFANLSLRHTTNLGCDPFPLEKHIDGKSTRPTESCVQWRRHWADEVTAAQADVAVFFVPQTYVSSLVKGDEIAEFRTARHTRWIRESLDLVKRGTSGADTLALSTLACHDIARVSDSDHYQLNDIARVKHVNRVVTGWARDNDVPVIDSFAALCPDGYNSQVNGVDLYDDGFHFSAESAPIVWAWMMPQVLRIADEAEAGAA